ncbi:MAG: SPOUT family RNA methylase [Candidatus Aenigmarchaeota archaeon]|nr:SPOUT family RNA methylase [Candidatus Aenigmarchaeota archaeon]
MKFLVTTALEKEFIVKKFLEEDDEENTIFKKIDAKPFGFQGILLVEVNDEKLDEAKKILFSIPEVEKFFKIIVEKQFENTKDLVNLALDLAKEIPKDKKISVRVNKRGIYKWKPIDIEREIINKLKELGYQIDIKLPDVIIDLEILPSNWVGASIVDAKMFYRKYAGKTDSKKLLGKITIAQLVYYTDNETIAKKIGEELARTAQAFEVERLVFLIDKPIDIRILWKFLRAADFGAYSRYKIQKKAYEREVTKTKIELYELYQFLRSINQKKTLIIITDPRGEELTETKDKLKKDLQKYEKIVIMNGSDHGIPPGCFRFAHYVVDLAPKIVFATEQTITSVMIALINL